MGRLGATLWSGSEPMCFRGNPKERRCSSEVVPGIAVRVKRKKNALTYAKIKGLAGCLRSRFGVRLGTIGEPFGVLKVA